MAAMLRFNSARFCIRGASMNPTATYVQVENPDGSGIRLKTLPLSDSSLLDKNWVSNGEHVKLITVRVPDAEDTHYFAQVYVERHRVCGWTYEKNLRGVGHVISARMEHPNYDATRLRLAADFSELGKTIVENGETVDILEYNRPDIEHEWYLAKVKYTNIDGTTNIGWTYERNIVGSLFCRVGAGLFDKPIIISCKFDDFNAANEKELEGMYAGGGHGKGRKAWALEVLPAAELAAANRVVAPNADHAFHELGGMQAETAQMLSYPNRKNYPKQCTPSCGGKGCSQKGKCWRSGFYTELLRVKRGGGRFLQVIDQGALGAGQKEEIEWATNEGIEICHWDGTEPFVFNVKRGRWLA